MLPLHGKELVDYQPGMKEGDAIDDSKLYVRVAPPRMRGKLIYEREMAASGIAPVSLAQIRRTFREGVEQTMEGAERDTMLSIVDRMLAGSENGNGKSDDATDASTEQVASKQALTSEELVAFGTCYNRMLTQYPPLAEAAADATLWNEYASLVLTQMFLAEVHDPEGTVVLKKDLRGYVVEETLQQLGAARILQIGNFIWKVMQLGESARKN